MERSAECVCEANFALSSATRCVQLKVYAGQLEEKMSELLSTDLCITINSDDPAYFGGYINQNYLWLIQNLGLSSQRIMELHANSFKASFLSQEAKAEHCKVLNKAHDEAVRAGFWA